MLGELNGKVGCMPEASGMSKFSVESLIMGEGCLICVRIKVYVKKMCFKHKWLHKYRMLRI